MNVYRKNKDIIRQTQYHDPLLNHITRKILSHLPPGEGKIILDIGCGVGRVDALAAKIGYEVVGFDIEKKAIVLAKEYASILGVEDKCTFLVADEKSFKKSEHGSRQYDVVVCSEVIEHVDNPQAMINFAYRFLKKNGVCIFTTPHNPKLWSEIDEYAGHVQRFTIQSMYKLFSKFHVLQIYTVGFPFMVGIIIAYRFVNYILHRDHTVSWRQQSKINNIYSSLVSFLLLIDDNFNHLKKGTTIVVVAKKKN